VIEECGAGATAAQYVGEWLSSNHFRHDSSLREGWVNPDEMERRPLVGVVKI
jgi:hypothetical protein